MSSSSSNICHESEDDDSWLVSDDSTDDENELTLLNGDEENDEDSTNFEAFIRLSMRLKKQYNLREASVALERCDKIWDTMQLLKNAQLNYNAVEKEEVDTDEEKEDENWLESSKRPSDSASSSVSTRAVPYIKYQPIQGNGNNALPNFYLSVKKQTKIYNCGTCGKIYNEKRAFKIHMKRDHGVASSGSPRIRKRSNNSETRPGRPKTPQSTDTSSVDGDKAPRIRLSRKKNPEKATDACPVCGNLYFYKGSLRRHAKDCHGIDIPIDSKKVSKDDGGPEEPKIPTTSSENISVKNKDKRAKKTDPLGINYVYTRARINNSKHYIYFCIICQKQFREKYELLSHMSSMYQIVLPKGPESRLYGLFIKDLESTREYLRRISQHEACQESSPKPRVAQRAGPKSSKNLERPKRACAVNTSYKELTKKEEEILLRENVSSETSNQPLSSSRITKCFLCKRSCVDIIYHLKNYHRISKPNSVLPLNEQPSSEQIHDKVKTIESREIKEREKNKSLSPKKMPSEKISPIKMNSPKKQKTVELIDETLIQGLFRKINCKAKNSKTAQCLMCMARFNKMLGLKNHLAAYMKDGVIQEHAPPSAKFSKKIIYDEEKTLEDPLKLDDTSSARSEHSSVKRASSSDESSSTSEGIPLSKRRKIEKTPTNIDRSRSDTGSEESEEEEEEAMRKMKKNFRYNRAKVKNEDVEINNSIGQRDMRDSSDRDSGIGISITIKKRNNSYEVVERDNCCEENNTKAKQKHFEASKNHNVISSDSSSDVTNSDDRNGDELDVDSRTREIFDPLDCSEERRINKPTTISTQDQDDDDITIVECTDSTFTRTLEQMSRQQNVQSSLKASTEIPGKVSSLKVLCRNLLKQPRVSCFTENHVNSHQCPVCCRFYPTERDVTVHMITHQVSRTTFRCTRILGIPKTALRRYRRRKTSE